MNRKNKKKTMAIILTMFLAFMAVGCSQGSQPQQSQPTTAGTSSNEPTQSYSAPNEFPIVKEPVTLTAWAKKRDHISDEKTNTMVVKYEEKTGVHIDWIFVPSGEYDTQLNLTFASGEYPDMYLIDLNSTQVQMCAEKNILLPLNNLIEAHGYNTKKVFAENPLYKEYLTSNDGNIYTLMETDVGVHMRNTRKIYVYDKWLQALGGKIPETTADLKEFLIKIRDNDLNGNGVKDEIPMISHSKEGDPVQYIMQSFQFSGENFYYIDDNNKLMFSANTEGWREGLRYLNDLYKEGLFYAEETYTQDSDSMKALVNKKEGEDHLVGVIPTFFQGRFIDTKIMKWTDYVPMGPMVGPSGYRAVPDNGVVFRLCSAISTKCEYPEVAMKWLDYWMGEEGTFANVYGLEEGVDYEMVDKPAFSGAAKSVRVLKNSYTDNFRFGENMIPKNDTVEIRYAVTDDESIYNTSNTFILIQGAKLYEPYYKPTNIPTIVWSDMDTASKMSEMQTLFNDYIKNSYTEFILGVRSLDTDWEAYLRELDNMGLNEYMNILRKYYSAN